MIVRNVHCVLKSGGRYDPSWVKRLHDAVMHAWPLSTPLPAFRCLTDVPFDLPNVVRVPLRQRWPSWWSKFELFDPHNTPPDGILYLDLDVTPVAELVALSHARGHFTVATDPSYSRINSGVMSMPAMASWSLEAHRIFTMAERDMHRWPNLFQGDQDALAAIMGHPQVRVSHRCFPDGIIGTLGQWEAGAQLEAVHMHGVTKQNDLDPLHKLRTFWK